MARKNINGVLLLNKPLEISSNNILQRVRYLFQAKKAGHTGALDPLATGMLPICFGETTKFATLLLDGDKGYTVTAQLGVRTSTSDREGEIISSKEVDASLTKEKIASIIKEKFLGKINQQPTIWSALKYQGKPLYEYARQGIEVPRPVREINIYKCEILSFENNYLTMYVECSKGTYIRTLVDDLGEVLGCGAHVSSLHRNFVEGFSEASMIDMYQLDKLYNEKGSEALQEFLLPIDAPVQHLSAITIDDFNTLKICQGMTIVNNEAELSKYYRVFNAHYGFLGVAQALQDKRLRGYRMTGYAQEVASELKTRKDLVARLEELKARRLAREKERAENNKASKNF